MALKDYYKGEDKFEIEDNMAFSFLKENGAQ